MPHPSSAVLDAILGRANLHIDWNLISVGWETVRSQRISIGGQHLFTFHYSLNSLLLFIYFQFSLLESLSLTSHGWFSIIQSSTKCCLWRGPLSSHHSDVPGVVPQHYITKVIFSQPLPPSDILVPVCFLISSLSPHKTVSSGTRCLIFIAVPPRPRICWVSGRYSKTCLK